MKKDKKEIIKTVKDIWNNPRGRACLFFGFYFIFFTVLIVIMRTSPRVSTTDKEDNSYPFEISSIEKGNYHFQYGIILDTNNFLYEGDKYNYKEKFYYNNELYFRNQTFYQKQVGNNLVTVSSPYVLEDFLDINTFKKLIKRATSISTTSYEDGNFIYNYEISTSTICDVLEKVLVDLDDVPNKITITTNKNKEVIEIVYDLSSYTKYKQLSLTSCLIDLKYSNFKEVKLEDVEV